jgi:2-methylcitrate dehydratase PrpD
MSFTAALAGFASGKVSDADDALAMMRLSLLDWAGCAVAGAGEPVSRIVAEMAAQEGGLGEASVIGTQTRLPARAAALVNGVTSHALDYDDTHFAHIGHPSVVVIPAALAVAQRDGASGAEFLEACLIGVEASIRAGIWLGRGHYQTGFHQTATAGTFGAAAAAGRLLGLDAQQMSHALGLAATKAAGLKSQFGTMGKPYNAGQAASAGVEVAQLAAMGFVSNPEGMEAAQGFGPTHAGEADDAALTGMGESWQFETISHKFHACCHGTHAMIEALLKAPTLKPDQIRRIKVETHPRWLKVCDLAQPKTGLEAKFSYRLIAALVLSGHDTAALETFSDDNANDLDLCALRDLVEVTAQDDLSEMQARVTVEIDGEDLHLTHDLAARLSVAARREKLISKLDALVGLARSVQMQKAALRGAAPDLELLATCLEA